MPSPLGHALAGATAGLLVAGTDTPNGTPRQTTLWRWGCVFAFLGAAPDLDLLLPVEHRGVSHSIGAAVATGLALAAVTRSRRLALAAAAAYATHILLDWLGTDTSAPVGVMALWPLSHAFYESDLHLFPAISRRFGTASFWGQNLRALARELLILLPPFLLLVRSRLRAGARASRAS